MNLTRSLEPLAPGSIDGLGGGARPSAIPVVRPGASDRPARSWSSTGSRSGPRRIGVGWLISIPLHAILAWGAAQTLSGRDAAEPMEAAEFVTRLDLRAISMVERAAREPVLDAQASPRQGIPEAHDDARLSEPQQQPESTVIDDAGPLGDELVASLLEEPIASPRSTAGVGVRGAFVATKLPGRRATTAATALETRGGVGTGGVAGSGGGDSGSVGVTGGRGTQPTSAIAPDMPPRLVEGHDPVYPALARRAGQQGRVECRLAIDATGRVTTVDIVTSSGFDRLDEAVRTTLLTWRFEPASEQGAPVACTILHGVTFRLVRN